MGWDPKRPQPKGLVAGGDILTAALVAAAVVVMGDFNDEPFDRSMLDYANSSNSEQNVTGASGMKICKESAEVVYCPSMMNKNGTPRRFGRPTSKIDEGGASDHLPVGVQGRTTR